MGTPTNVDTLIQELRHGQHSATQLQQLLHNPDSQDQDPPSSVSAHQLSLNILTSFTRCLSLLTSSSPSSELSQDLATSQADSADDRRSEHSGDITKRPFTSTDRRGCYKRKKSSHSWTVVSSTIEDGYAWRKYGQKEILNAKYPRSYFRCTRKYDQGCKAVKQVQKMDKDPQLCHIIYIGHHTCKDILNSPQIVGVDSSDPKWDSCPLNYGNHHVSTVAIKQEESSKEDTPSDLTDNVSNTLDSTVWKEFMAFDYGAATEATSQNLDMDFVVKSLDFGKDFHFDEIELL